MDYDNRRKKAHTHSHTHKHTHTHTLRVYTTTYKFLFFFHTETKSMCICISLTRGNVCRREYIKTILTAEHFNIFKGHASRSSMMMISHPDFKQCTQM